MEQPAALDGGLRRCLDVQDALAGGHPLRAAVTDVATAAEAVVVLKEAVDHVRDRFEPAVRGARGALGLTGPVVDRGRQAPLTPVLDGGRRVDVAA
jgi:hypothetical protein